MWSSKDIQYVQTWYPKMETAIIAANLQMPLSSVQVLARGLGLKKDYHAERINMFWHYVNKTDTCWNWSGGISAGGYGNFSGGKIYKCHSAHVFSWFLANGPVPDGKVIDHKCNNRKCVNPEHLRAITQKENVLRSDGITAKNKRKTHCPNGHEYTIENTRYTKSGQRKCRQCGHRTLYIGISGKKGSGKDTFAQLLSEQLKEIGISSRITHFADPLKEMCIDLFHLDSTKAYGSDADKNTLTTVKWDGFPEEIRRKYSTEYELRTGPMSYRELLQVMGTDIMRNMVEKEIWAKYPFRNRKFNRHKVVMIADVRFPNECESVIKNSGIVIRIHRDTGHSDNHPSEIALDGYNWTQPKHTLIDNNRTLDDLRLQAALQADLIKRKYL